MSGSGTQVGSDEAEVDLHSPIASWESFKKALKRLGIPNKALKKDGNILFLGPFLRASYPVLRPFC